jgi:hypothetical protein
MGGGMEVNKNKWIEEWNAGRENLEFNFRWTRRNLAIVGLFGVALPFLIYKGVVREFVRFFLFTIYDIYQIFLIFSLSKLTQIICCTIDS